MLLPAKFNEFCLVLGVKEMCCLEPEKKTLEKAFRKKALKCHPDKVFFIFFINLTFKDLYKVHQLDEFPFQGGDPIEFKKLNDAYLKLIGHIQKVRKDKYSKGEKKTNIQKVRKRQIFKR